MPRRPRPSRAKRANAASDEDYLLTIVDFAERDEAERLVAAWLQSRGLTEVDVRRGELRQERNSAGQVRYRAHLDLIRRGDASA